MKIHFDSDIKGFQNARKLKLILEFYHHSDLADKSTLLFIESLQQQLNDFLASPEFAQLGLPRDLDDNVTVLKPGAGRRSGLLASIRNFFAGPTKLELLLSKQRHELIERAERAEAMAFEVLAESADIGEQRDDALARLKQMQSGAGGQD